MLRGLVRQSPKPQSRTVGHRKAAGREQASYLGNRPADGGAVDPEEQAEDCVGRVVPQMAQRGGNAVGEDKLVPGPCSGGAATSTSTGGVTSVLDHGLPGRGELDDQIGQVPP